MNGLTPPWFMEAFVDAAGLPLSGGRIYFFVAGSTVMPKTIYSDAEMTIPLSQPLVLDAGGVAPQYFMESGQYKVVVCTPTGDPTSGVIRTRDNVEGSAGGDAGGPFLPLAGQKRVSGWVAFDATVYGTVIDMRVFNLTQAGLELKTGTRIYGGGSLEIESSVYMDDPRALTLSVDSLGTGPGGVSPINSTHLVGRDPVTGELLPVELDLPFELLSSVVPIGSKVDIYSGIGKTVTSLSLPAGEWDVWGVLLRDDGNPDFATYASASLSTSNNVEDPIFRASKRNDAYGWLDLVPPHLPIRVPSGSTYPVYLVAKSTFTSVSQAYVYGNLYARRVR